MAEVNKQFEDFMVDETTFKTLLTSKFKNRKSWTAPDNRVVIKAFLPGTVTQILVNKGEHVKVGQVVAKFEAMKMINNIQASVSGKIKEVHIKEGDIFSKGALLIEFE